MSQLKIKQILEFISAAPSNGNLLAYNKDSGKYENTSDLVLNDLKVTGALKRNILGVTEDRGLFDIKPNDGDAFLIAIKGAEVPTTIRMSGITADNAGQSGTILIINALDGAKFDALPVYMKTPSGAAINFATEANVVSIISYFIIDANNVLCNYVGDFS